MAWIRRRDKSQTEPSKKHSAASGDAMSAAAQRSPNRRVSSLEVMEPRTLMATDTLWVGGVYFEEDAGSDLHGDLFQITFKGGAAGTELNRIIIDGDQTTPGFGAGDVFFDTVEAGLGADHAFPFRIVELVTADPTAKVTATVQDGSTRLILDFENFRAGDKLVFEIDVDEVEDYNPAETNLTTINDGFDPITSGVEFQGSLFQAFFSAPHFVDASATGTFMNRYDSLLAGTGLDLPEDNFQGKRDRSTGVATSTNQIPLPVTLAGKVWVDNDLNLVQTMARKTSAAYASICIRKTMQGPSSLPVFTQQRMHKVGIVLAPT
jgi:serine-aspartate repeat-containing protein C/D/E